MKVILFVCDTNFVLSPIAAAFLNQYLTESGSQTEFKAISAGTFAGQTPRAADRRAIQTMTRFNIDLKGHQTRQVSQEECNTAFRIVALSEDSLWYVRDLIPERQIKLTLLSEYGKDLGLRRIPDPVMYEIEFDSAAELINKLCKSLHDRLRNSIKEG